MDEKKTLFFLHIPKTAGTTLGKIVRSQYPKDKVFVYLPNQPDTINEYSEEERKKMRLVAGHYQFGWHKHFPGPFTYFTVMRDPVVRMISLYRYLNRKTDHRLHEEIKSLNIVDFSKRFANAQTKFITGLEASFIAKQPEEALDMAKKNLQTYFSVVGIQERFDETLLLAKHTYEWKKVFFYDSLNAAPKKESEFSEDTLKEMEEHLRLDIELYKFADDIFENQIRFIPEIDKKLKRLRRNNDWYSKVKSLYKHFKN